MMPELEPLEADVLSLLRAEKPIADLEPTAKAAILAAVEARIGLVPTPGGGGDGGAGGGGAGASGAGGAGASGGAGAPGAGGAGASGAAAGVGLTGARAIAAIAATFAIGVATGLVVAPSINAPTPPRDGRTGAQVTTTSRAEPLAAPSSNVPMELPAVSVGSLPAASSTGSVRAAKNDSPEAPAPSARGLGAERSLLDVARAALARGEAAEALAAVDRHSREYPDGVLVEEREALAIKALVALGRRDEARARAKRFEQRFPNGLMLRAVKGAIGDP
jgi:hypothetical protein